MTRNKGDAEYVLGVSEQERERLHAQGDAVGPMTERFLIQAGIGSGMKVLDVGCGTGEVSILAARLVGADGTVLGIDREPQMVATARTRALGEKLLGVSFVEGDFREIGSEHGSFDAAIGRLVLMYQADPVDAVRRVAKAVRPGGVIFFQEFDSTVPPTSLTPLPLHERVRGWIWSVLERSGADVHLGFKLYSVFTEAGLAGVEVRAEAIVQTPSTRYPTVSQVRVLLPRMIEYGIATQDEVDVETLEERLLEERKKAGTAYLGHVMFGAWGHRPG
jgi:2-polyprenyl-3-methyl-5-hydroxy-6-metoxy-1,4-benzoquinol methylase